MELGPNQKRWIEMLRSGEYEQISEQLTDGRGYCCLGVACLAVEVTPGNEATLIYYPSVVQSLGLIGNSGCPADVCDEDYEALVDLNDNGMTFSEIADLLEAKPQMYFRESK